MIPGSAENSNGPLRGRAWRAVLLERFDSSGWFRYALLGALLVLLLVLPGLLGTNYLIRVAVQAGFYVILALGLNIVVGYCGLLDLGYVAFYAIGAYTYAFLASPHFGLHLPFWAILPLAAALPAILGVILGTPTLRLRGDYLAIVTLGFGEMIRLLLNNMDRVTNGPKGISNIDPISLAGYELRTPRQFYYLVLFFVVVFVLAISRLVYSRVGRAWAAVREDEEAATAMGLNTHSLKLRAFATGAAFAGVAGCLFAGFQGFASPESFTFGESVIIFCMITLGGMGSIPGVIVGALTLVVLPEVLRPIAEYRMLIYGLLLIVMMVTRPQGLWPSRQRSRELLERGEA